MLLHGSFELWKVNCSVSSSINGVEHLFQFFPFLSSWLAESVLVGESNNSIMGFLLGDGLLSSGELFDNPVMDFFFLLLGKFWPLYLSLDELFGSHVQLNIGMMSMLLHSSFKLWKIDGSITVGINIVENFF